VESESMGILPASVGIRACKMAQWVVHVNWGRRNARDRRNLEEELSRGIESLEARLTD